MSKPIEYLEEPLKTNISREKLIALTKPDLLNNNMTNEQLMTEVKLTKEELNDVNKSIEKELNESIKKSVLESKLNKDLIEFDPSINDNELLIRACEANDLKTFKLLLKHPKVKLSARNYEVIKIACDLKNLELLKLILSAIKTITLSEIDVNYRFLNHTCDWFEGFEILYENYDLTKILKRHNHTLNNNIMKYNNIKIIDYIINVIQYTIINTDNFAISLVENVIKYDRKEILIKLLQCEKFQKQTVINAGVIKLLSINFDNDEILQILLNQKNYDPSCDNNHALKYSINNKLKKCTTILLNDDRVMKQCINKNSPEIKLFIHHNKKIKEENEKLKKTNDELSQLILNQNIIVDKLKKENEEFKFKINELKKMIQEATIN